MEGKLMHKILSTDANKISPEDLFKHLIKCAGQTVNNNNNNNNNYNNNNKNRCCPACLMKMKQQNGNGNSNNNGNVNNNSCNVNGNQEKCCTKVFDTVSADDLRFMYVTLQFNPEAINKHMFETESNSETLKEDLLALVKLFFAFGDGRQQCFETIGVERNEWEPLKVKYQIDMDDLAEIAWTYPYLSLMILKVYTSIERPVHMNLMREYKNFKPEFRFAGLFGLVPPNGRYGGFVKALLHHMVLQIFIAIDKPEMETHTTMMKFVIALARAIYHSGVQETCPRDEFIQFFGITPEDCLAWSEVFDRQYPEFTNVHSKYFEQLE